MIKEKELRESGPAYQCVNGREITLQTIQNAIDDKAKAYEIPVSFYDDQIKYGGMLNSSLVDCIVLYHPEHRNDYLKMVISIKRQGTMAFISIHEFGESKNMKKLGARAGAGAAAKAGLKSIGGLTQGAPGVSRAIGGIVGGSIGGAVGLLRSVGGSKAKQEEENYYYGAVAQILNEVFN